jgi:LytS/YehU family sensor histidine kinase
MPLMPFALQANFGLGIYLIVASAAHAMAFYRRAREREHQALALVASRNQAKLDALRLQLQPHFLFNTLNAISALIPRRPADANTLVLDLGDLLRASLQTSEHEVTLARELELLDRYLAIEQTRLGDRLRIVRDIPEALRGAYVPTLLLQPLAENAVRHGLEARIEGGTLTLRARRLGDLLVLTVEDDGVAAHELQLTRRGIGLANTEERLRMLHDVRARFDLRPNAERGVCVEIAVPFRTESTSPGHEHLAQARPEAPPEPATPGRPVRPSQDPEPIEGEVRAT